MVGVERIIHILVFLAAGIGVLPLLPYLAPWVLVLLGVGFLLGGYGDFTGRYLFHNRLATLLSIGLFVLFVSQASFANLVYPMIHFLCSLLAVRLASEKSPRHVLQLFLLATIVLASSSLITLDLAYLFYLVLVIILVSCGLVLLSFYQTDQQICFSRKQWVLLLKTMVVLPAGSLVLMLVLFVILPRTQMPLWNFLNPKPQAVVGMSDQVNPGSVAELAESSDIAFRAETEPLSVTSLYWRTLVFNRLEGRSWKRSEALANEKLIHDPGSEVDLMIYSEPKVDHYLVGLDWPLDMRGIRNQRSPDGVIKGRFRDNRKVSYRLRAQLSAVSRQTGSADNYLQLPEDFTERLNQVAAEIENGQSFEEKIQFLDGFFLAQQLSYSTRDLPESDNPLDTFLFDSRRGYCEYFASAYAVLLRMAGVPARLVGGYLGGDYNRFGGYYLVGEDAAHVWVEALNDNGVWQRIDPSMLAINADESLLAAQNMGISLQGLADAVLHNWSRLVLNYDLRKQFSLARSIVFKVREFKSFDLQSAQKLIWFLPIVLLAVGLFFYRQRRTFQHRVLKQFRKILAKKAGVESISQAIGIYHLAGMTSEPLCREFVEIYGGALYRDQALRNSECQRLRKIVRELKKKQTSIEVAIPELLGDNGVSKSFNHNTGGSNALYSSQHDQGSNRRAESSVD